MLTPSSFLSSSIQEEVFELNADIKKDYSNSVRYEVEVIWIFL